MFVNTCMSVSRLLLYFQSIHQHIPVHNSHWIKSHYTTHDKHSPQNSTRLLVFFNKVQLERFTKRLFCGHFEDTIIILFMSECKMIIAGTYPAFGRGISIFFYISHHLHQHCNKITLVTDFSACTPNVWTTLQRHCTDSYWNVTSHQPRHCMKLL